MATTIYTLEGVPLDYCRFDWPLYRGTKAQRVTLVQSVEKYRALAAAATQARGIVRLNVKCSGRGGRSAPRDELTIEGLRVEDVTARSDGTSVVTLWDARKEVESWVCKKDLNVLFRDGYLDGTRQPTTQAAVRALLDDIWGLFEPSALQKLDNEPVPDDLLYSGIMLGAPLEDLLSRFGAHLTVTIKNKLTFATRQDVGAKPVKGTYSWVRGNEPGWVSGARTRFRKARKLRYYYRRKLAVIAELLHSGSTSARGYLKVALQQVYQDGNEYLTPEQLFTKYGATFMDDAAIGIAFMSENFEGTPIARDGSADRDQLHRIIKADWRRLYRVEMADSRMGLGGLEDLQVGVFKALENPTAKQRALGLKAGDITGEVVAAGGLRGEWTEFLNVISGGPRGILDLSSITQHKRRGAILPTAPYTATWENENSAVLRFKQERLPDNNFAIIATVKNPDDMKIAWRPARVVQTAAGPITTRWGIDAPARGIAKLEPSSALALLVGTQRSPNNAERWEMVELEGDPKGDLEVQEFEVSELPAVFDYIDTDGRTDGKSHPARNPRYEIGKWLNEDLVRRDAERRRELYLLGLEQAPEGPGVAAGLSAMKQEAISGALASMTLQLSGPVVTTELVVANLATDAARDRRAQMRATLRRASAGGKTIEAS